MHHNNINQLPVAICKEIHSYNRPFYFFGCYLSFSSAKVSIIQKIKKQRVCLLYVACYLTLCLVGFFLVGVGYGWREEYLAKSETPWLCPSSTYSSSYRDTFFSRGRVQRGPLLHMFLFTGCLESKPGSFCWLMGGIGSVIFCTDPDLPSTSKK